MDNVLNKRAKGNIGEDIACKYLESNGFKIIERNYQKKWGELDIIALKETIIHFFEVKSVLKKFDPTMSDTHRPEDNVDGWKMKHLRRIIETYLSEKNRNKEEFHFHVLCVYMNSNSRKASVKWLKDIIL
ncbi:MAG: YraN family protein [Candidatus Paceibacterota bacterium]|jgi:putative endonuclease